jgi:hypothetical protein
MGTLVLLSVFTNPVRFINTISQKLRLVRWYLLVARLGLSAHPAPRIDVGLATGQPTSAGCPRCGHLAFS